MASVPFLPGILPANAKLFVQVAWGADLSATDLTTWVWSNITEDVIMRDGITAKLGRGDEAEFGQPAECHLALNNASGAYSLGAQSSNWPNVRKSVPVRIGIDHDGDGGFTVLFVGYADSWQPVWDQSGNVAEVQLTASGVLRRLQQHKAPVQSSMRRYLSNEPNVVALWPLEDGKLATFGQSAFQGHPPMRKMSGEVEFAADTESFASTVQMPRLKNGALIAEIPPHTVSAGGCQFRFLIAFPENGTGMTVGGSIVRLHTEDPLLQAIDVCYASNGSLFMRRWFKGASRTIESVDSTTVGFAVNGRAVRMFVEIRKFGTELRVRYGVITPGASFQSWLETIADTGAAPPPRFTRVVFGMDGTHSGLAIGQVAVQNELTSLYDESSELDSFEREITSTRFTRLAEENGIPTTFTSPAGESYGSGGTDRMGEQLPLPLSTLLQEIQDVDRGIIYDGGSNGGLSFISRRSIEAQVSNLVIDVAAGDLAGTLAPVDDDQGLVNRATVTRTNGGTAVHEDVDGPKGTSAVGIYDSSLTISVAEDVAAAQYASWIVALGTVEGYRYPAVEVDVAARPNLAQALMSVRPGDRVTLANIPGAAPQHPAGNVELVLQGIEHTLSPFTWRATLTCTPYGPWAVGRLANTDGTASAIQTEGQTLILDTDDSSLSAAASQGATSLSVATNAGPIWTTDAADMPVEIEVGGIVVTVTAIAGAASPQTFTVEPISKALTAGLSVAVHEPQRLAL